MHVQKLPPALQHLATRVRPLAGKRIALIAPAGGVRDDRIDTTLAVLSAAGVHVHLGQHVRDHNRYLAGSTEARLHDLHTAFALEDVAAVWCLRGGYGCAHLVDHIDWTRIPAHVPLIGYSDITVLLEAFRRHGKSAIHGPVATSLALPGETTADQADRSDSIQSLVELLDGRSRTWPVTCATGPETTVTGALVGGNLTMLASMSGTPHAMALESPSILLIEDVGEAEFRLERSFHQLINSIELRQLQAVCLGSFARCSLANGLSSLTAIFAEWLSPHSIPLYRGLPSGHGYDNQAWPYGMMFQLDAGQLSPAESQSLRCATV